MCARGHARAGARVCVCERDIVCVCVCVLYCLVVCCVVLSCLVYWPSLLWSQTVRGGAHGLVYSKCVKANLNLCGSLIVASLSGSEFQSFIVLRKKDYL